MLRKFLDKQEKHFRKGGKLEKLFYLWEAVDGFLYTSDKGNQGNTHIRDVMDLKRMMMMVVIALVPAVFMALYNTGYQANLALSSAGTGTMHLFWQTHVMQWLGLAFNPANVWSNLIHGALYFFPVYILTLAVGGFWEVLFASVRKHEVNEGFLVTSLLFPLILPPTIPYWQVALGITFGVVIGKEVFGGVGMNILNPALTARVFLYFAYPGEISGDKVWVAVDGLSKATPLGQLADPAMHMATTWWNAFVGLIPGSMGETSALACLIGAFILIITSIGSWRIMLSSVVGLVSLSLLFNAVGSDTNSMFAVTPMWHFVLGGYAFGAVFMATDPVSAPQTIQGHWLYGFLIGALTVLVRVINPAFPEGIMLAILFMNIFSPLIDRVYINQNIKRRQLRNV